MATEELRGAMEREKKGTEREKKEREKKEREKGREKGDRHLLGLRFLGSRRTKE